MYKQDPLVKLRTNMVAEIQSLHFAEKTSRPMDPKMETVHWSLRVKLAEQKDSLVAIVVLPNLLLETTGLMDLMPDRIG